MALSERLAGGLHVDPDPVAEGETLEVFYGGGEGAVMYSIDGGPDEKVDTDASGQGSIQVPAGASVIIVSGPNGEAVAIEVVSGSK